MHAGASVGWNKGILAPEVLFTFPSVYTLFPTTSRGLTDRSGKSLSVDYYRSNDWLMYKLGIFADRRTPMATPEQKAFLDHALERARAFRQLLAAPVPEKLPRVLVVNSKSHPTLETVVQNGAKARLGWDFESAPTAEGDGRVIYTQSFPPHGVKYEIFTTQRDHSTLLNDEAVIRRIHAFQSLPNP